MEIIFKEIIEGNLPEKNEKGEFILEYRLYHVDSLSKDIVMKFNLSEADSEIIAEMCKNIFKFFGHRLDEKTKKWGK